MRVLRSFDTILAANSHIQVIVGMSGGVDSSLSAVLLREAGYRVRALFMQNWDDDDDFCTARQDYKDALAVCKKLGIELKAVNFAREYWDRVFSHFLEEYSLGRTPNPDILCNKEIKFKAFLDYAVNLGADYIATGHYARIARIEHGYQLQRGADANKDQSYFLYTLGQKELSKSLFPIGDMNKSDVRELAKKHGLHVFSKKDSTGICFIGERKFNQFLSEYFPASAGDIVSDSGIKLGKHQGLMYYTLGQRQGLGIGGRKDAGDAPWYVLEKDLDRNELIVGQGHDHPALFSSKLSAGQIHWTADTAPPEQFHCSAKVRYRQLDQTCFITVEGDDRICARFEKPVRAVTPGQSIVLYDGEVCLGGGVIQ